MGSTYYMEGLPGYELLTNPEQNDECLPETDYVYYKIILKKLIGRFLKTSLHFVKTHIIL